MKQQLLSYCLKGDMNKAFDFLQSIEKNKSLDRLTRKYYNRFFNERPTFRYKTKDPWIKKIMKVYYAYFISVLTHKKDNDEAESILVKNLNDLLPDNEIIHDIDSIENRLVDLFHDKGLYFLGGVTPPFRGPYIWSKQEKVNYEVNLPDGPKKVTVYFLSDFLMLSWLHFATFGERSTGGWAKKDALYCVKERYEKEFNKPNFLYSYLAHEAQHLSDFERYPNLLPQDLEYRAKLVELIYHPSNNKTLIKRFLHDADDNRENPHPYASYVICTNLSKMIFNNSFELNHDKWKKVEPKIISKHAEELFHLHTNLLDNLGADQVKGIV